MAFSDEEAFSDEDYVVVGTPLENDYVSNGYRREVKDAGVARQLPSWKQEVTDSEGRRRFHGAFTGGFSAGYYNTVGSKEGWAPKTFTSSRGKRDVADQQQQKSKTRDEQIDDLLDEDERAERKRRRLESTRDYDTFASRAESEARDLARYESRNDQASVIPGGPLLLDTIIKPVSNSIGVRMLLALGWRRGKGIGSGRGKTEMTTEMGGASCDVGNTPVYIQHPKDDNFGLGYDPFKDASEFSRKKKDNKGTELAVRKTSCGGGPSDGFGFGVFDEDDDLRVDDVYGVAKGDYNFEIVDEEEAEAGDQDKRLGRGDGGRSSSLHHQQQHLLPSVDKRALLRDVPFEEDHDLSDDAEAAVTRLEGFECGGRLENRGDQEEHQCKWFPPPKVPREFAETSRHQRQSPSNATKKGKSKSSQEEEEAASASASASGGAPAKADPPKDAKVLKTIDSLASFVAKNGETFESLAKERNAFDSKFNFLFGGVGSAYYKWKLHKEREKKAKTKEKTKEEGKGREEERMEKQKGQQLDAAARSNLLKDDGEGFGVSRMDYVPKKKAIATRAEEKPPQIAKADKRKLQSELNSMFTSAEVQDSLPPQMAGLSYPSKAKGQDGSQSSALQQASSSQGKAGEKAADLVPVRTQGLWQPDYLLCKRFGVKDPHQGRAIPVSQSRGSFRSDSLLLPETSKNLHASAPKYLGGNRKEEEKPEVRATPMATEEVDDESKALASTFLDSLDVSGAVPKGGNSGGDAEEEIQYVEKPLDLFKKIFSDSEEESESESEDPVEDPKTKEEEEKLENESDPPKAPTRTALDVSHTSDVLQRFKRKKHRRKHRKRGEGGEGEEKDGDRDKGGSHRQRHHRRHHRKRRDRDHSP